VWDITSYTNGTGGVEIYFVREFQGNDPPVGVYEGQDGRGIVISSNALASVLGHEIGHGCGLKDIYDSKGGVSVGTNLVKEAWEPQDWNSGPSPQYYVPSRAQEVLVRSLLMYGGALTFEAYDIPIGEVYGVKWGSTNYVAGQVKVGLENKHDGTPYPMNRNPVSN
jgi:hypothetical protein